MSHSTHELRTDRNISEWRRYLLILAMLKDDRSQSYIAKKLGFNNASSIANILNRFSGLETLIQAECNRAIKIHDLEQRIEGLDIQCSEGNCKNCDRKRPILKRLQADLEHLNSTQRSES